MPSGVAVAQQGEQGAAVVVERFGQVQVFGEVVAAEVRRMWVTKAVGCPAVGEGDVVATLVVAGSGPTGGHQVDTVVLDEHQRARADDAVGRFAVGGGVFGGGGGVFGQA